MSVIPVFHNNKETASIISSKTIHMSEEISDTTRTYVDTKQTQLSTSGVSFQNPNLNTWVDGEIELVAQLQIVFTGTTIPPAENAGTPAALWTQANSTVDGFCLNKLISEIKFSIGNKQWTEVDRQNPILMDIFAQQFDKEAVESYGIYGKGGLAESVEHVQSNVYGSGVFGSDYFAANASTQALVAVGFDASILDEHMQERQPWQQNTKGYVKVLSNTITVAGSTATSNVVNGLEGVDVPVVSSTDVTQVYNAMTQTVVLEIHEFIISPYLSNPYSRNKNKKIYYAGGYPFNMSLAFNAEYMKSLFKWNDFLSTTRPTVTSCSFIQWNMRFWTFDTAKELPKEAISIIYYKQDEQTSAK